MQCLRSSLPSKTKSHLLVRKYEDFQENQYSQTKIFDTALKMQHQYKNICINIVAFGNVVNNYHLLLKESFIILKLKLSLEVARNWWRYIFLIMTLKCHWKTYRTFEFICIKLLQETYLIYISKRFHTLVIDNVNRSSQKISKNNANNSLFYFGLQIPFCFYL